jgi:hypothetical protein
MNHGKLDRRHKGFSNFKYYVEFPYSKEIDNFVEQREWCWEQWGPSCEIDVWYKITKSNWAWCWIMDDYRKRLYFATDKEYTFWLLKWK